MQRQAKAGRRLPASVGPPRAMQTAHRLNLCRRGSPLGKGFGAVGQPRRGATAPWRWPAGLLSGRPCAGQLQAFQLEQEGACLALDSRLCIRAAVWAAGEQERSGLGAGLVAELPGGALEDRDTVRLRR